MNDEQLSRYSRHILLPEIDYAGQARLNSSNALIIGLGGLGSPLSMYLASSGVGRLILCDYDQVELTNLQRQIVHHTTDLGRPKVESARETLLALNPNVTIETIDKKLDRQALAKHLNSVDIAVDATDNFASRFMLNETCFSTTTPLISGAATRFEGQVSVFDPTEPTSPCYRCLYNEADETNETCSDNGVFAPLVGIVASIQAAETLKYLLGIGTTLGGRLLLIDAKSMIIRSVLLTRDPACPICGGNAAQQAMGI